MVFHKDLTGANLHEPKGIDSASDGQVYIADGAGSGVWTTQTFPSGNFLITTTYFTSSGTWTKPNDLICAEIHCVGSGGASNHAGAGATGGSVSFGSHCSATGGAGGGLAGNVAPAAGGTGTGDLTFTGNVGVQYSGYNNPPSTYYPIGTPPSAGAPFGRYGNGQMIALSDAGEYQSGAAGGYAVKYRTSAQLGATETVTVGTAGANNGIVVVKQFIAA